MERRIFYAARPHEVLTGLLSLILGLGLLGLLAYGLVAAKAGGSAWVIIKVFPFTLAAAATMLYRERVIADQRSETVEVRRSFFLVPLSRKYYSFSQLGAIRWRPRPQGQQAELVLELPDGSQCVLHRAAQPDPRLSREVRSFLGLPENPLDDALPPPPPPTPTNWRRLGAITAIALVLIVGAVAVGLALSS